MYDYLIKNGLVVDGSGKPAVKADVAVKGDKVARIAPDIQEPAAEVYDAAGKYVIPGLIDPHVHEEWYCFDDGRYESYIRQGVTTLVNGNCSHSITPGHKKEVLDYYLGNGLVGLKQYQRYLRDWPDWHDFEGYAQAVEQVGTNCNRKYHPPQHGSGCLGYFLRSGLCPQPVCLYGGTVQCSQSDQTI